MGKESERWMSKEKERERERERERWLSQVVANPRGGNVFSPATGRRLGVVMLHELHAQRGVAGARSDSTQPHHCPLDPCPVHHLRHALVWSKGARPVAYVIAY